jgi:hypothetical protein
MSLFSVRHTSLALLFGLSGLAACSQDSAPDGSAGKGSSSLNLEQSDAFTRSLDVKSNDEIVIMSRLDESRVSVASKSGRAWIVDLDEENVDSVDPYLKFDTKNTRAFTVSQDYVWAIYETEEMIGRNKSPAAEKKNVEISKVSIEDLDIDMDDIVPLAASKDQLFFLSNGHLVVSTFEENAVAVKMVTLPDDDIGESEFALGAGPIDDPAEGYGYWIATTERLLLFKLFSGKEARQTGEVVGLFGANVIATLEKPNAGSSGRDEDEDDEDDEDRDEDDEDEDRDEDDEDEDEDDGGDIFTE